MDSTAWGAMGQPPSRKLTDHAKAIFLESLSASGNVTQSARACERSRRTLYTHRDNDPDFAEAWDDAIEQATDALEMEARRRAEHGVPEPVFYQGVQVGTVQKYSDTLMIQLLKAHHPKHRETVTKVKLGGDPDGAPIKSLSATIDTKNFDPEKLAEVQKIAQDLMQSGAVKK